MPRIASATWGKKMYYVYILKSDKDGSKYIGVTSDLKNTLNQVPVMLLPKND